MISSLYLLSMYFPIEINSSEVIYLFRTVSNIKPTSDVEDGKYIISEKFRNKAIENKLLF